MEEVGALAAVLRLLLFGLLVGDGLLAAVAGWLLWRERRRVPLFGALGRMLATISIHLVLTIGALASLPPELWTTAPRWGGFRVTILLGLIVLAAGVWPAAWSVVTLGWQRKP